MNTAFWFEIVVKATVLLAIGLCSARYLRHRPAVLHMVWAAIFVGIVLLPLLATGFGKGLTVFVPGAPAITGNDPHSPSQKPSSVLDGANDKAASATLGQRPQLPIEVPWEAIVGVVWLAGFLVLALRTSAGLVSLAALRRFGTRPVEFEDLSVNSRDLAARVDLKPNWELRQSVTAEPATAMTWGVLRPVVLLPKDANHWSPQRLEAVLLHEFAHVRRLDFASQLLAELACALYWFHPLAWLGARAMRAGAESAADDAVLRSGVKASDYATELLQIAADLGRRSQALSRVGVPIVTQPKIESRLQSVLSPAARNRGLTSVQFLAAVAAAAFAVSALGALHVQAKPVDGARSTQEGTQALIHVKNLALAAIMYANDFDDLYPYMQGSDSASGGTARVLLAPYTKDQKYFFSPTPGGQIHFNMNLAGVKMTAIDAPAEIPLWFETLPDKVSHRAYAFADGHAKLVDPGNKEIATAMKRKFPREAKSKPLPAGYLVGQSVTGPGLGGPTNNIPPGAAGSPGGGPGLGGPVNNNVPPQTH